MTGAVLRERTTQAASLILMVALWTAMAAIAGTEVLPAPWEVAAQLGPMLGSGDVVGPLAGSLARTLFAFAGAMALGLAYGIGAARSSRFDLVSGGVFSVALFAPTLIVTFVGLLVLGSSRSWAVVVITSIAVFPTVGVYVRDVMRGIDRELLAMADAFKVGTARRVRDVYVPYLTPPILSSSRIALNSSWKVVVLCEVFGFPGGLGFEIRNAYAAFDIPTMLAWVVVFVAALLVIEQIIRAVERTVVRWA